MFALTLTYPDPENAVLRVIIEHALAAYRAW
jgi:hypothetical protein